MCRLAGSATPEQLDERGRVLGLHQEPVDMLLRASQGLPHRHALQCVGARVEDDRVPGRGGDRLGIPSDAAAPEVGPRVLRRLHDGSFHILVRDEPLHLPRCHETVVQTLVATHVVVLEVDEAQLGIRPVESIAFAIAVEEPVLGDPIELARQLHGVVLEGRQDALPPFEHLEVVGGGVVLLHVLPRPLEVLPLHLHRGQLAAVRQADQPGTREVAGDVVERRHGRRQVRSGTSSSSISLRTRGGRRASAASRPRTGSRRRRSRAGADTSPDRRAVRRVC